MKKYSYVISVSLCVLLVTLSPHTITAQEVTFSLPDSTGSLGINPNTGGLMGFAWGDYDGDGDLDLLLGGSPSVLFRNDVASGGGFVRVSAEAEGEAGKILFDAGGGSTNGAVWADFDGNGKLDLLVGDTPNLRIFLNDGSVFTIADPTATGLNVNSNQVWGVTAGDFDRNGDVDIAMAGGTLSGNGGGPPHVLQNNNAVFTDVAGVLIGPPLTFESWSPQWVDVNNDGFLDLWLPLIRPNEYNAAAYCELLINANGVELVPSDTNVTRLSVKSAIVSTWGDYNNDGYMDLWLHPFTGDGGANKFYRNNGDGTFTDVAPALGMDSLYANSGVASRGASFGDLTMMAGWTCWCSAEMGIMSCGRITVMGHSLTSVSKLDCEHQAVISGV